MSSRTMAASTRSICLSRDLTRSSPAALRVLPVCAALESSRSLMRSTSSKVAGPSVLRPLFDPFGLPIGSPPPSAPPLSCAL